MIIKASKPRSFVDNPSHQDGLEVLIVSVELCKVQCFIRWNLHERFACIDNNSKV
jgi:hypothetical protein